MLYRIAVVGLPRLTKKSLAGTRVLSLKERHRVDGHSPFVRLQVFRPGAHE
jgi:hypothetical protein